MFAPKSVSRGVAGSYCWVDYMGKRNYSICSIFPLQQKIWGQSCSAVLIFRNPRKAMFAPKSVSRGVAGSYWWVYYMGKENYSICSIFPLQQGISRAKLFGYTHFPQPPESNVCPQKCLQGVPGSYCWVYYMCIGDYSICSIFPLQQKIWGQSCSAVLISQPPESNVCPQKCL